MCLQLVGASGIQTQRNFESDAGSDMVIVTLSPLVVTILHPQPFQHEFELIFSGDHHNAHVARDKASTEDQITSTYSTKRGQHASTT